MIKLYLDEDVHKKVAVGLRLKGYDAVSAHEVQKQSLSDEQQLVYAVSEERAIFTFNAGDFDRIHKRSLSGVPNHYGIILSRQIPVGETVKRLSKFLFSHSADELRNSIYWL
jgi:uncharacterized protein with PIN domain